MSEERFQFGIVKGSRQAHIKDCITCKSATFDVYDDRFLYFVDLLNQFNDELEELRQENHNLVTLLSVFVQKNEKADAENEQLRKQVKKVYDLLVKEVDVFSDEATKHDINAYRELRKLDNKDAYYIATGTKEAIDNLKELLDNY